MIYLTSLDLSIRHKLIHLISQENFVYDLNQEKNCTKKIISFQDEFIYEDIEVFDRKFGIDKHAVLLKIKDFPCHQRYLIHLI